MNGRLCVATLATLLLAGAAHSGAPLFPPPERGFFTQAPKRFARIEKIDMPRQQATLALEPEGSVVTRAVRPDLDVFLHGAFGLLRDLQPGQRVWVVFDRARAAEDFGPIRFIADEVGIETIHDEWYTAGAVNASRRAVTLTPEGGKPESHLLSSAVRVEKGDQSGGLEMLRAGDRVRFGTRCEDGQNRVAETLDATAVERAAAAQEQRTTAVLRREGVPGEMAPDADWPHEAALLLYRPGGDWARALDAGASLNLSLGDERAQAVIRRVGPWGDKTRIDVSLAAEHPAALKRQPVRVFLTPPPASPLPPGLGKAALKPERIAWLISSVYCSCGNGGDVCTGQLYTLSLCNADTGGCAMPEMMRRRIGGWIDEGKSDAEILGLLQQQEGLVVRHLHLKR